MRKKAAEPVRLRSGTEIMDSYIHLRKNVSDEVAANNELLRLQRPSIKRQVMKGSEKFGQGTTEENCTIF